VLCGLSPVRLLLLVLLLLLLLLSAVGYMIRDLRQLLAEQT